LIYPLVVEKPFEDLLQDFRWSSEVQKLAYFLFSPLVIDILMATSFAIGHFLVDDVSRR
jgi:hypothetical protein